MFAGVMSPQTDVQIGDKKTFIVIYMFCLFINHAANTFCVATDLLIC